MRIQRETGSRLHHSVRCYRAVWYCVNDQCSSWNSLFPSLFVGLGGVPVRTRVCESLFHTVMIHDTLNYTLGVYIIVHCTAKILRESRWGGRLDVKTTSFPWSSCSSYKWKTRSFFIWHFLNHVNSSAFFLTEIRKHFNWSSPSQLHLSRCVWPARM